MALPRRTSTTRGRHRPARLSQSVLSNAAEVSLGEKLAALTAAAVRVQNDNASAMRRLVQPWEILALAYYDQVGECWSPANFKAQSLSKIRLFAGERDEDGEISETDNTEAQEIVARIQDPGGGGYSRLLASYGRLRFLIGEGYLLVTNPDGGAEGWEFVSPDELRINGAGEYTRFFAPSLPAEELGDVPDDSYEPVGKEALVYRLWRPHPRFSRLADSALRAQLKTLEELQLLSLAIGATAKNRMAVNGIMLIADSIADEALDSNADEDPNHATFLRDVTTQIVSPIVNPGTAAAAAPVIMVVPDDRVENGINWVQISDPTQTYPEEGIRTELIRRFAVGIDLPAEILTGTADVNHWGAWLIDEQAARDYVFPDAQTFCTELTSVVMRPMLKDAGVQDFDKYVIAFDGAAVIAHPNRGADATEAHDRLVISDAAYRDAKNFNDDDAPDEDEYRRRAALKIMDPSALTDTYNIEPEPVAADEQQTGEEAAPEGNERIDQTTPDTKPDSAADRPQTDAAKLAAQMAGACRLAVIRSRELAGAKLRRVANGNTPEAAKDAANQDLAAALGADWVRQHANEVDLVNGGTRILTTALRDYGLTETDADRITAMVATHAARTLYLPQPGQLPRGLLAFIDQAAAAH